MEAIWAAISWGWGINWKAYMRDMGERENNLYWQKIFQKKASPWIWSTIGGVSPESGKTLNSVPEGGNGDYVGTILCETSVFSVSIRECCQEQCSQ